jgi:hypothetical protein
VEIWGTEAARTGKGAWGARELPAQPGERGGGAPAASLLGAGRGGRRWPARRGARSGGERSAE